MWIRFAISWILKFEIASAFGRVGCYFSLYKILIYSAYKETNKNIKLKYDPDDTDNYKYSFKKGKFQMLVTYSTDEENGKMKKTQLKTKKITIK